MDILQVIVFAIALFLFVYLLVLQPHKIKGASMHPNFPDAEYLLTDKISYRFNSPQRGDVVVFKSPVDPNEEYIKRIIGLPGEAVSVKGGKVYINNRILPESYLASDLYTSAGNFLSEGATETVPADQYFVLGDNRPHSSDSRAFGFINFKVITGRAWLIYWPINKAGIVPKPDYGF